MRAIARTGQSRQQCARTISMSIPAQLTVSSYGDIGSTSSFVNIWPLLSPEGPDVFVCHSQVSSRQGDDVGEQTSRDVLGVAEGVLRDGRRDGRFTDCDRHLDPGCTHRTPPSVGVSVTVRPRAAARMLGTYARANASASLRRYLFGQRFGAPITLSSSPARMSRALA